MTDYYTNLGISNTASIAEIKSAHRKLAKTCHPDKVPNKEDEFRQIQKAYETLVDPERRQEYDEELAGGIPRHAFRATNSLHYVLIDYPGQLDHYTFLNAFLELDEEEQFAPGKTVFNLDYQAKILAIIRHQINWEIYHLKSTHQKPDRAIRQQLVLLKENEKKIAITSLVLLGNKGQKSLYDLTFNIEYSEEMILFVQQIGGLAPLLQHIRQCERIYCAEGVFALWRANCLTPQNFARLTQGHEKILHTSVVFGYLLEENLLNQENIDLLYQNIKHIYSTRIGLGELQSKALLNQQFFNTVVRSGKYSCDVALSIIFLVSRGILNEENDLMVIHKMRGKSLSFTLGDLEFNGELNKDDYHLLSWKGSPELVTVNNHIEKMFAYGLFLLSHDAGKGKNTMLLALELKSDLKLFFEQDPGVQENTKNQFKLSFIEKLHSRDHEMSHHRNLWKVIVANIFISFTGLGLFAIGLNYFINGGLFFNKTKREKLIDNLEISIDLAL